MRKRVLHNGLLLLIMMISYSCFDSYQPPGTTNNASYLVVDAFVNSAEGSASVILSHTIPLTSTDTLTQINDAEVKLQDDADNNFTMNFEGNGIYAVTGLMVSTSRKYRLLINSSGKTYQSDFVAVQPTPAIDTVSWSVDRGNLNINVSTHDPSELSRFYRWKYSETWEYDSPVPTSYIVKNDSVWLRTNDEDISQCWQTSNSKTILLYSTDYLTGNIVNDFVLQRIPSNSIKLSNQYSIFVQQQTLTKEGYLYWLNVKKTTESLGSLFDPLPGAVVGNIKCLTVPNEPVIGFFSAGSISEKRIFIKYNDIRNFVDYEFPSCKVDTILCDTVHTIGGWYGGHPRIHFSNPDEVVGQINNQAKTYVKGYAITSVECTDCRKAGGGNTVRPPFWKN
jgi:hypothetical protein